MLKSGVEGFDKMLEVERSGGRPINRPRSWEEDERQKKKELQSKVWFRAGGYDVSLFVPYTPKGELAKRIRRAFGSMPNKPEVYIFIKYPVVLDIGCQQFGEYNSVGYIC